MTTKEELLREAVNMLSGLEDPVFGELGFHVQSSLPEMSRAFKPRDIGQEIINVGHTFGGTVAIAHGRNLFELETSSPSYVLSELASDAPRFNLRGENWPLRVIPVDQSGGSFDPGMDLGLYVGPDQAWILWNSERMMVMNEPMDSRWTGHLGKDAVSDDLRAGPGASQILGDVVMDLEIKSSSHMSQSRWFGPVLSYSHAVRLRGANFDHESIRSHLELLGRIAAWIKARHHQGDPMFRDAYRTRERLEEEERKREEAKKAPPAGNIRIF